MSEERSAKHKQARELVPDNLKPQFDKLVEDYRYHTLLRHGAPYVSYFVLADLVMFGWRRVEGGEAENEPQ